MQEREAKLLQKTNDLDLAVVYPSNENNGWCIRFQTQNSSNMEHLESKRNPAPRVFKTSDAALRCCQRIGFERVDVELL